ncbi:ras-related protein Rap-1-like [Amphibalanus amphitrite]|uniref:ras-related protein Rap-1-like n=1 Tax=Amphibalanus amphitrite TaxID=1232801 RepID=UPI001C902209|nr:ras-related protein Rap-1-like [Amphibalanus amphitrite]
MTSDSAHHVRLLVLGGPRVGKTSICRRFLYGEFETRYRPTLEEQYSRTFQLGGTRLELDVLDTCGDNSFPAMRRVSIAHAQAFLLVFSVDSHSSLLQAADCFGEIRRLRDDYREVPTLLAGNKSDVPGDERQVNSITASNWFFSKMSAERGRFLECSALRNTNVTEVFRSFLVLGNIPTVPGPSTAVRRQLSLRLSRRRAASPAPDGKAPAAETDPASFQKARSKSLIRRASRKKAKPAEMTDDQCGVQ